MKKLFALLLLFTLVTKGFAQKAPSDTTGTSNVKSIDQLSDQQLADWKSVQNVFYNTDYDKVKDENKISLNCKSCNAFYADVVFKINKNGKLEYYKLISSSACGRPFTQAQESRIMKMFYKFEYPASLRNTTFKVRLGSALKC